MMTDQTSKLKVLPSTPPAAAITGNGTTTGATVDVKGFGSLTFVVSTGVITDGTLAGTIFAGDQSNMSDEVALTAADLIGAPSANAVDIAITDDGVCERVGVNLERVKKRYFRLKLVQAAATTGGFFCAQAILGQPFVMPVASP